MFLTGRLTVEGPDGTFDEADLPGTQGRVAFAALVLHRHPLARDELAELLWGGAELPDAWGSAVNSLVSKIRRLLTGIGLDGKDMLRQGAGSYQLVIPADGWVDVEDATRRLDRAEGALRRRNWPSAVAAATVASAVFGRPFLTGSEGLWVERERARLTAARLRCYEVLSEGWRHRGDPGLAVIVAARAIEVDPLRESAHRLCIEAELARGDRAAARRAYQRCVDLFRDELGVGPSPATTALVEPDATDSARRG